MPTSVRCSAVLAQQASADCHGGVARVTLADASAISAGGAVLFARTRTELLPRWSELSWRMQALARQSGRCGRSLAGLLDADDPGLSPEARPSTRRRTSPRRCIHTARRPRVAILREQGVNSQLEMAAAFQRAGFEAVDVHMTDLLAGRRVAARVRRAGCLRRLFLWRRAGCRRRLGQVDPVQSRVRGRVRRVLRAQRHLHARRVQRLPDAVGARRTDSRRRRTGRASVHNRSGQFEARLSLVEVLPSRSVLLEGMAGSRLLVPTSHGEGRAEFAAPADLAACESGAQLAIRYVDNRGAPAALYPANPNGSPGGIAGLCSADGRVTILMPHPERVQRSRAALLASGRLGRRRPLAAPVPQRAGVCGVGAPWREAFLWERLQPRLPARIIAADP